MLNSPKNTHHLKETEILLKHRSWEFTQTQNLNRTMRTHMHTKSLSTTSNKSRGQLNSKSWGQLNMLNSVQEDCHKLQKAELSLVHKKINGLVLAIFKCDQGHHCSSHSQLFYITKTNGRAL